MPYRRRVLLAVGSLPVTLAGCNDAFSDAAAVVEVVADLRNGDDGPHVYRIAVETAGGLGEWHAFRVPGRTSRTVSVEPPDRRDLVAVHGIVDDRPARVGFSRVDLDGRVCPHVHFSYRVPGGSSDPVLAETADVSCR